MDRLVDLRKRFHEISPFVRAAYKFAFQSDDTWERMGPTQLINLVELNVHILPSEFERVVRHLVDKRDLVGYLQNNKYRPELTEIYSIVKKCADNSQLDAFENWIAESLQVKPEYT